MFLYKKWPQGVMEGIYSLKTAVRVTTTQWPPMVHHLKDRVLYIFKFICYKKVTISLTFINYKKLVSTYCLWRAVRKHSSEIRGLCLMLQNQNSNKKWKTLNLHIWVFIFQNVWQILKHLLAGTFYQAWTLYFWRIASTENICFGHNSW